ncbi:hypothetical protein VITU102760_16855 [Vibrio tubiashii]
MPYSYRNISVRPARLPAPNRHITGQGHYRTPQRN